MTEADRRAVLWVVRAKPVGLPLVEKARVERIGRTAATMAMPGGSRLLVPLDAKGQPAAGGSIHGVFGPDCAADAYRLALAEIERLRAELDARQADLVAALAVDIRV